ncbi:MAG: hypothetical protein NT027_19890 [Proteobacteria bacterium]|nr:hypothetical protein [Pseudomonadota bacterium]
MYIKRFLVSVLFVMSTAALAAPKIEVKPIGHGVSEVSYRHKQPTCLGDEVPISIEQFQVLHPRLNSIFFGSLSLEIGDKGALDNCHVPGPTQQETIIRFLIETDKLGTSAQILSFQRASKYTLKINGVVFGYVETGLLGDHEIHLNSNSNVNQCSSRCRLSIDPEACLNRCESGN